MPLKPCFYQDFADEIPIEHQVLVKRVYRLWLCEWRAGAWGLLHPSGPGYEAAPSSGCGT